MIRILDISGKCVLGCGLALAMLVPIDSSYAGYKSLYSFRSQANDGENPVAGLTRDSADNLYGTTVYGGAHRDGTVFELAPDGIETVLYSFCSRANCSDGESPDGGLIEDRAGNLYGTTASGGAHGKGTVFKLAPDGTETVLYSFCSQTNCSDGELPEAGLIEDRAGRLYGTTYEGGAYGYGTVFKLARDGTETVYSFAGGPSDGQYPLAGLTRDKAGNLYGTTVYGGAYTDGAVFRLAPDGTETVLYSFCSQAGCSDGLGPEAGLIEDAAGNLFGTTEYGGTHGGGIVFELAPDGTETVLYSFCSQGRCRRQGDAPRAGLIEDKAGNLYGTTDGGGAHDVGTVFKLAPDGTETVLHSFAGYPSDGDNPLAGLIVRSGYLYGTTENGGAYGYGTVFRLRE